MTFRPLAIPFRYGRTLAAVVVVTGLTSAGLAAVTRQDPPDDATLAHLLGRLTWGARPGDVAAVRSTGVAVWLDRQLHPERIDDAAAERALASLPTLAMSSARLLARYQLPRQARQELQARRSQLEDASDDERRERRRELMARYASEMDGTPREVLLDLQAGKVLRAVTSERQLDDVLTDFWMNHFNVYAQKGPVRFLLADYERVVRAHAWGRFEDLLVATAKSPAMLFYLDNWLSSDPHAEERIARQRERRFRARRFGPFAGFPRGGDLPQGAAAGKGRRLGLNENYARELMELHTLGVDGGYTQQDVTEVARAFTGWTIRGLRENRPEFVFDPRRHDPGDKRVLGQTVRGGGEEEGLLILHRLATHPSTARFLAGELARRFVSDDPPKALVERAADVFLRTGGDIRELVRTIVTSPEMLAPAARSAKVKTPLEFVVSAVRASGATVTDARALAQRIAAMGMPLYGQQPPTGYKDTADAWVSAGSLVARLNFAVDLTADGVRGVTFALPPAAPTASGAGSSADAIAARLLPIGLSESTRRTLESASRSPGTTRDRLAALVLGSPEFQRR